jgi:seryl-tRNA synthetase
MWRSTFNSAIWVATRVIMLVPVRGGLYYLGGITMLDMKELRDNFEQISAKLAKRGKDYNLASFLEMDKTRRELIRESEDMKARQNAATKQIPQMKKEGKDTTEVMAEMKSLSDTLKTLEPKVKALEDKMEAFLLGVPNTPNETVPEGNDETDNVAVRFFGSPAAFDFEPKPHWELGEVLGILDPATAAKVTGARFTFYKGAGARLERALINFMLDMHVEEHGYIEIWPPLMVHRRSMIGTGQLPKFEEDMFSVADTEYYLVPTAEVPVTNFHREEILDAARLPIKYCAYSPNFRAEAGSAGRDTRGLIRQHQFNKVEMVKFTKPEDSYKELEALTLNAEEILKKLNLPYRVVNLCAGDLGFCAAQTYDIEVWMPSYNRYVEISSCSNFEAFQARRAGIRFRDENGKVQHVHTLNGSGLAVGRTTAAIIENCQQADGSIRIPDMLVPYMRGVTSIC